MHPLPELQRNEGSFAYWSICQETYEVNDRGDGVAEIIITKPTEFVNVRLAQRTGLPVGFPIRSHLGYVRGNDTSPWDMDQQFCSAFPGTFEEVPVSSIEDLERLLGSRLPGRPSSLSN